MITAHEPTKRIQSDKWPPNCVSFPHSSNMTCRIHRHQESHLTKRAWLFDCTGRQRCKRDEWVGKKSVEPFFGYGVHRFCVFSMVWGVNNMHTHYNVDRMHNESKSIIEAVAAMTTTKIGGAHTDTELWRFVCRKLLGHEIRERGSHTHTHTRTASFPV